MAYLAQQLGVDPSLPSPPRWWRVACYCNEHRRVIEQLAFVHNFIIAPGTIEKLDRCVCMRLFVRIQHTSQRHNTRTTADQQDGVRLASLPGKESAERATDLDGVANSRLLVEIRRDLTAWQQH